MPTTQSHIIVPELFSPEPPLRATLQAPALGSELPAELRLPGQLAGAAARRGLQSSLPAGVLTLFPAASSRQLPARCRPEPRPSPTCYPPSPLPPLPNPLPALPFPRDSQLLGCLPQGATKPGQLDSAARNPLRGAAGLARRAPEPLRMCAMRAAESHATPPSDRLPALSSDTTLAVGNFPNLARTGSPHTPPHPRAARGAP